MSILDEILAHKADEVAALRRERPLAELDARARGRGPARGFARALRAAPRPAVIAEFKRASPSAGEIRPGAEPAAIARAYAEAGAACLSVLTDARFFRGAAADLEAARAAVALPVLRKDFTIDALQIAEARALGADAVLLIVAALDDAALGELMQAAKERGLDALVEVHTRAELERALEAGAELIGINNRDLKRMVTDLGVSESLVAACGERFVVSESGLREPADLERLGRLGVGAFLIGESLMRAPDPGAELRRMRGEGA